MPTPVEKILLAALLLASLVGFLLPVGRRLRLVVAAPGTLPVKPLGRRILRFIREVCLQETVIRQRPVAGTMHALVFWGFMAFGLVTVDHFAHGFGVSLLGDGTLFGLVWGVATLFAYLVILGMAYLAWRRFIVRPKSLGKFSPTSLLVTALILTLMVTHLLAPGLGEGSVAAKANWWIHASAILGFLFLIPNSKHLHLVLSPATTFFKDFELAAIRPLNFEKEEFGADTLAKLSKHTVLGAFTCVECGRCEDHCPATGTGKTLNPKQLMLDLKDALLADPTKRISGDAVPAEIFWQCTTCGACTFQCPVGIDQVVPILETRRGLVAEGNFPPEMRTMFDNLEKSGNPWGYPREEGEAFLRAEKMPPAPKGGTLFWLGCMGRYDAKYRKSTSSFAKTLTSLGVPWGVLPNETCTGDAARRAGNEFLFQQLATKNVAALTEASPKTIVTSCPHCLRTLKEYKDLGLDPSLEIVHHTEYLSEALEKRELKPAEKSGESVVYHDPCYLSRYAGKIDEPRNVIAGAGFTVQEPERNKEKSFCCGAGGAMLFTEERQGKRINRERTEELLRTGAKKIGVACPFCAIMVRDAVNDLGKGGEVVVEDVAEIAAQRLAAR